MPVGDAETAEHVRRIIREGMVSQNRAYNMLYSRVYAALVNNEGKEKIRELWRKGERRPKADDPGYSLYPYNEIRFVKGIPQASALGEQAKAALAKQIQDGLLDGKVALANRKITAPMWIKDIFSFYHGYESGEELRENLYSEDLEIFMQLTREIRFKVVFGNPEKSRRVREEFIRIFEGTIRPAGSSIQLDKTGKITLNLCLKVPENPADPDENRIVGVDLGIATPAVCALNEGPDQISIGSAEDFFRVRTRMQEERQRLQRQLVNTRGGHGRKKKLAHLEILNRREKDFVTTYNHMVSRRVVEFALKNKASCIHLEDLAGYDSSKAILRNWSYSQLQKDIIYKASAYGIRVRKINPYLTSQTCSFCGSREKGQRISQAEFLCKNPECSMFGKVINADVNAARNIARSKDFSEDG